MKVGDVYIGREQNERIFFPLALFFFQPPQKMAVYWTDWLAQGLEPEGHSSVSMNGAMSPET